MNGRGRTLRCFLVVFIAVLLVACSRGKSEPKKAVKAEKADAVQMTLAAEKDINPNERGNPAPLNVFVYGIKSVDAFENSDYFTITEGNSAQMQTAASKIYEAILQPGESRVIMINPGSDVKAFGIIGAYRNISHVVWNQVWEIPDKPKLTWWQWLIGSEPDPVEVNVGLRKTSITINKMD
ncbi:type VI secretion system lipoprotein TssJ [Enterobacillus tribolii]|nr:type VI secretion system lipoprotein TssJ [Enterobacillus tribolii]